MRKIALITAGGSGLRMGADRPKQFLLLKEKSLLYHSIAAFQHAYPGTATIVVVPPGSQDWQDKLLQEWSVPPPLYFVAGGPTRFHSVQNGLRFLAANLLSPGEEVVVWVHDGVRCLVAPDLICRCAEQAEKLGSAIPVLSATESVRLQQGEQHVPFNRDQVLLVQTPQTFRSAVLLSAFEQDYQPSFTDEATVVEQAGHATHLIEGDFRNIKITRPIDLDMAAVLMQAPR